MPVKKVKLGTVADQAGDVEVVEMNHEQVAEAYTRCAEVTGGPPTPHQELTVDQLTSLNAILRSSGPRYVDSRVWGPFGHRISKRVNLSGMHISSNGEVHPVEL